MKPPKKIVFASQTEIGYLQIWVDEIVEAISQTTGCGAPLFLSDESEIGHSPLESEEDYKKLSDILGFKVGPEETYVEVAKKLKKLRER